MIQPNEFLYNVSNFGFNFGKFFVDYCVLIEQFFNLLFKVPVALYCKRERRAAV